MTQPYLSRPRPAEILTRPAPDSVLPIKVEPITKLQGLTFVIARLDRVAQYSKYSSLRKLFLRVWRCIDEFVLRISTLAFKNNWDKCGGSPGTTRLSFRCLSLEIIVYCDCSYWKFVIVITCHGWNFERDRDGDASFAVG